MGKGGFINKRSSQMVCETLFLKLGQVDGDDEKKVFEGT